WGFISADGREVVKPKYEKINLDDVSGIKKTNEVVKDENS
ncbi:MAG: WG repeat-containing protein, partial [Bacteroidales bacterium]|nr:WG repeat-containing protein [Bacteroidales bacterium]